MKWHSDSGGEAVEESYFESSAALLDNKVWYGLAQYIGEFVQQSSINCLSKRGRLEDMTFG